MSSPIVLENSIRQGVAQSGTAKRARLQDVELVTQY